MLFTEESNRLHPLCFRKNVEAFPPIWLMCLLMLENNQVSALLFGYLWDSSSGIGNKFLLLIGMWIRGTSEVVRTTLHGL